MRFTPFLQANLTFITLVCAIFLLINVVSKPSFAAKRVALVIGNGAYHETPLLNPANDANDMARSLQSLGFDIVKAIDADLRSMHDALDIFCSKIKRGDVALFFYAGHGVQVQGENYLLPIKSRIRSIKDVRYEALQVGRVLDRLEELKSMNIIILDACRNNPLGRGFKRSVERGLAVVARKPEGSILAFATAPGKTAADGSGRNGLFTEAVLRHMKTPGLDIEKLFKIVRVDVKQKSFGKQVPWSESSLTEDFYLGKVSIATVRRTSQTTETIAQPIPGVTNTEALFWQSIKDTNNAAMYEAYLNRYPNGVFSDLARIRINELTETKEVPAPISTQDMNEIGRDENYISYDNGIVFCLETGLQWVKGEDKPTSQNSAKKWAKSLDVDGGGWRLPKISELKTLYNEDQSKYNMTKYLFMDKGKFWSDRTVKRHSTDGHDLYGIYLDVFNNKQGKLLFDSTRFVTSPRFQSDIRALAVRSKE